MVSIIIPVYNSEFTLSKCLDSVLSSTYTDIEVLLLDDGSIDNSLSICKEYAKRDNRIRIYHHNNHGVSYTRNRGLDETIGDYVMFVDSDDTISSTWIEAYVNAIKINSVDMAIGSMTEIDVYGNSHIKNQSILGVVGQDIWKYICNDEVDGFGYIPNKIYSRDLIKDLRFNEGLSVQEDMDFVLRAIEKAKSIFLFQESGYFYYYVPVKRKTFYRGLLDNQIRILNNYELKFDDLNTKMLNKIASRICGLVYLCLKQYSEDTDWVYKYDKLRNDIDLKHFVSLSTDCKNTSICKLLLNKKYIYIYIYFKKKLFLEKIKGKIRS